jgi:hypothetical protein
MKRQLLILFIVAFFSTATFGQEAAVSRPSPLSVISMKYKDAYVKIVYSQPSKRGRQIFGSLVPYGEVWRTGANEATEITLTRDMLINNQTLKAGTYSLFTIPDKGEWTIILNAEVGLWGAYNYNIKLDVFRFTVPAQSTQNLVYEAFTMKFDQKNELANLLLMWDKTLVTIPMKFI